MRFLSASIVIWSPSWTRAIGPPSWASGRDVADDEAVRAAGEAAVGHERDVVAEPRADDGRRWREHLRHARAALGAFEADDDHVALLDLSSAPARAACLLRNRSTRAGPLKSSPSLPVILATAPSGARLPRRIRRWPVALIGFSSGWITSCPALRPGSVGEVFGERLARHRQAVAVDEALLSSRYFITAGVPPTRCRSAITYLPLGLRSARYGTRSLTLLEVVDRQLDADRAGHGDQMQHGVGRAAERHHQHHRVLERLAGHDVARLEVEFQQMCGSRRRPGGIPRACSDPRPASTSCRGATCPSPRWRRPSCWPCTCRRRLPRRTAPPDDCLPLFVGDLARKKFAVALKGRNDVERLVVEAARLDRAAVDHERGAVEPAHAP